MSEGTATSERPLRVVFITAAYLPWLGGIEVLAAQILSELQRRGHTVGLITSPDATMDAGVTEVHGVPVLRTGTQRALATNDGAGVLRCALELGHFVRDIDPDVVHTHDTSTGLWMYLRAHRGKHPLVATVHNVMSAHAAGELRPMEVLVREATWVTGVSQAVVDDTAALFPEVADRLSLVRNAVRPSPGSPGPPGPGAPLLCIGRLVPQKGFDMAIDAFARIADAHPGSRLRIAGVGPEGPGLVDRAARLGLQDRLEMLGRVEPDDVPALLGSSLALVMPSRYEGLPLVALEAAWAARPVVAMAGPGLTEAVVPEETGVLVPPGDVGALARAMDRLLSDPGLAHRLGAAGRRHVEAEWSLEGATDAYEAIYRAVAITPSGPTGAPQ